jgi:hypothetical protein
MAHSLPQCEYQVLKPLPSTTEPVWTGRQWIGRLELQCSLHEISHDEAKAHVMLTQRMACVVREGARGPKNGRGKLHYNVTREWPPEWMPNRFNRYFIVFDEVEAKTYGDRSAA